MIPAARLLPNMIASVMLLASAGKAEAAAQGWEENGQASWYGSYHQGRPTSSGELFNPDAMTAAHANLPLGSRVRVTLRDTGDSVVVTINDRQPRRGMRIIDLSHGAAARLGIVNRGVGMVHLAALDANGPEEVAEAPDDAPAGASVSPRRRGRLHTPLAHPMAAADRPCCLEPSAAQALH